MTKDEITEKAFRALDLFEANRGRDAISLMHGLVGGQHDGSIRAAIGDEGYDVLMEIFVFVTSGDLKAEGRSGGYSSIKECEQALQNELS